MRNARETNQLDIPSVDPKYPPAEQPPADSHQGAGTPVATARPVRLEGLNVTAGSKVLLRDTNVQMPAGKITVIVGGSGAGKSVLLRILSGLLPPHGQVITWSGHVGHDRGQPLGRVGIVFQQFALFDELSPLENVQFAIDHRRDPTAPPVQTADQWLEELRVPTDIPVAALSGGQKQRLAIARTLAADPELVLYDEPTSGLDAASGRQVAGRIAQTQQAHGRTSVVVTHDYETLLPIADHVLLLDSDQQQLIAVPREAWPEIPSRMKPVQRNGDRSSQAEPLPKRRPLFNARRCLLSAGTGLIDFLSVTGTALEAALRLPLDLIPAWPRVRWGLRFLLHYLRLVCGPSAWVYVMIAGIIVGFTGTYFTFRFLPYSLYTKPLLLEDLLTAIGFALYRVLVPVLATTLVAARCGAAVAADVGVKKYGSQIEAIATLGVRPTAYLLTPIVLAFIIGTPILQWLAFQTASAVSLVVFSFLHPEHGPYFWKLHFEAELIGSGWLPKGAYWLLLKTIGSGAGVGAICYYRGARPKESAADVSHAITSTVLWATLYVLLVHFVVAFCEF